MKKIYILLLSFVIAYSAHSQCTFTVWAPPTCDSNCDEFVTIWTNNTPQDTFYVFINGIYFGTIGNQGMVGPLCPGTYNIFITDSASCNFTDSFSIFVIPGFPVTFNSQDPSCPTCNDGSITAIANGNPGLFGYSFLWSNGATTQTISNLTSGIYCVTVTDSMQCSVTECDTIGFSAGTSIIGGTVFLDLDTNGIQNGFEPGLSNFQVDINPGGYTVWSSLTGNYFAGVPNGNYNISLTPPANWFLTSSPATYNTSLNDTLIGGHDFGLLPDTAIPSAQLVLTADIPRCNWYSSYVISYTNTGLMLADGEIIFNLDPLVTFDNAIPAPTTVSGNTYTWSFNNLYPFQPQNIVINVTMPPLPGTQLNSSAIINLFDLAFNVVLTDTVYKNQTVTCSWDPNDKLSLPEGIGNQNIIPLNSVGDFTIRFQNTGNDTAFVVVIKDTLHPLLDRSTFELLAASHEVNTELNQNGVLTFTFNNILLPDSNVNEPASHGFVRYKIRPVSPVADPTVITNTAHIFFDQNPAVVTNTTLQTFSDNLLSIAELSGTGLIMAYPNPFADEIIIKFEKKTSAKADLIDYLGRIIRSYTLDHNDELFISRGDMKSGLYLLRISSGDGTSTLKLIAK